MKVSFKYLIYFVYELELLDYVAYTVLLDNARTVLS